METRVVTAAELCLQRDCRNLKDLPQGITAKQVDRLRVDFSIAFASGYYRDMTLDFELRAKESYPFDPPKVTCKHLLFHPNVCPTSGAVCMNLLGLDWRPTIGVESIMVCVLCMFLEEELHVDVETPLNKDAAEVYQRDRREYVSRTRTIASK